MKTDKTTTKQDKEIKDRKGSHPATHYGKDAEGDEMAKSTKLARARHFDKGKKKSEEVRAVDQAGADWIHVDVMDGRFVPNITIGPLIVEALRPVTKKPLDVHLMITQPERYIEKFRS